MKFDSDEGRRQTGFPSVQSGADTLRELEKVHSFQNRFSIGVQSLAEVEELKKRCRKHGRAYGQFAHYLVIGPPNEMRLSGLPPEVRLGHAALRISLSEVREG